MTSQNEFYFKNQLMNKINQFIEEEFSGDHDLGYLPDNIDRNMTEAAWLILVANKSLNDYLDKNDLLS